MVNYVVIDSNKKPLKLIKDLKPDFLLKDLNIILQDYRLQQKRNKMKLQNMVEIIFTPGDVVYLLQKS